MKYDCCIFTGGSVRGLSYVGILKAIEALGIEFDTFIGSSIGALTDDQYIVINGKYKGNNCPATCLTANKYINPKNNPCIKTSIKIKNKK